MVDKRKDYGSTPLALKYRGLLDVSETIVSYRDLTQLFLNLEEKLRQVIDFDFATVSLYDQERNLLHRFQAHIPLEPDSDVPLEIPLEQSAALIAFKTGRPVMIDLETGEHPHAIVDRSLRSQGIKTYYLLPMILAGQKLGALSFASRRKLAYDDEELVFFQQVAKQVAVAIDNATNFEKVRAAEQQLTRERDQLQLLLEVNNAVASHLDLRELLHAISGCLRRVTHHRAAALTLYDPETKQLRVHALETSSGRLGAVEEGLLIPLENTPPGKAVTSRRTILINRVES